jgi:hypothetical protein
MATYEEMKDAYDKFVRIINHQLEDTDFYIRRLLSTCGWKFDEEHGEWYHLNIPEYYSRNNREALDRHLIYFEQMIKEQPLIPCDLIFRQDEDWWKNKDFRKESEEWKTEYLKCKGWYRQVYVTSPTICFPCNNGQTSADNITIVVWEYGNSSRIRYFAIPLGLRQSCNNIDDAVAIQQKRDACPNGSCVTV